MAFYDWLVGQKCKILAIREFNIGSKIDYPSSLVHNENYMQIKIEDKIILLEIIYLLKMNLLSLLLSILWK